MAQRKLDRAETKILKAALRAHLREAEHDLVSYTMHLHEASALAMRMKRSGVRIAGIKFKTGFEVLTQMPKRDGFAPPIRL